MRDDERPTTPAEAGKLGVSPSKIKDDNETMTVEITHNGGNRWTAYDEESGKIVRVELDGPESGDLLTVISGGEQSVSEELESRVLKAVVSEGPKYREGPQEALTVDMGGFAMGGGVPGGTESSDGSDGSGTDASDRDIVNDPPQDDDRDGESLENAVNQWLSNYTEVKTGMIDGGWHVEYAEMYDPRDDSTEMGVYIRCDPWDGPYWDQSENTWVDDDRNPVDSQPDAWAKHNEAMSEIFQSDDVKGIPEDNDDTGYTDWYNYVPADEAEEFGGA